MNILISSRVLGGIGGQERNLYEIINALSGHTIHLYAQNIIPSEFIPEELSERVQILETPDDERPFRSLAGKHYDLYIHFFWGTFLADRYPCAHKAIIPSGNAVADMADLFDYILHQSPAGKERLNQGRKHVVLPPPLSPISSQAQAIDNLPHQYVLTVFNPYPRETETPEGPRPLKGQDILYKVASASPLPIVWCHSDRSIDCARNVAPHPNIVPVHSPTRSELRYLYTHASAYVSYSRNEGFGWSIADALLFHKPVIARNIGVLTYFPSEASGLYCYENTDALIEFLRLPAYEPSQCDMSIFRPACFRRHIEHIALAAV